MGYINVGASDLDGKRIKSKKALKELLSQDPASVVFDSTSGFTPFQGTARDIQLGNVLTVCGPDPYTKRNWWAKVTINAEGKIVFDDKVVKPTAPTS